MLNTKNTYSINNGNSEDLFTSVSLPSAETETNINLKDISLHVNATENAQYGEELYKNEDYSKAFEYFLNAAQQGYPSAQCKVASMYYNGIGVEKNFDLAIEWYLKAAKSGDPEAQYNVAKMYKYRDVEPEDESETIDWFTKAAEQGHEDAIYQLLDLYELKSEKDKVLYWLEKGATLGYDWAQYELGRFYYDEEKYDRAVYWYEKAADQNNIRAINELGDMYFYGNGVYTDEGMALRYYRRALELGDESAQKSIDAVLFELDLSRQHEI